MGCEEDFDLQELQGEECYGGWTFQELAILRLWRSFSLKKKAAGGVLDTKRYFAG